MRKAKKDRLGNTGLQVAKAFTWMVPVPYANDIYLPTYQVRSAVILAR